ncbi:MAG: rhamnogalacturonan acetylesterase [Pseudomonadota bacterium]
MTLHPLARRAALLLAGLPLCVAAADVPTSFRFDGAGAGVLVAPDAAYERGKGYGLVAPAAGGELSFTVQAAPGDYAVTVTLGAGRGRVAVLAEDRRLMLAPLAADSAAPVRRSFVVNVRNAALKKVWTDPSAAPRVPIRGEEASGRAWDEQLTISLAGAAPALQAIEIVPVQARRILLGGDSTVAAQTAGDAASWGQMLSRFVDPAVAVANHARSGETLKSFMTNLRWDKLMSDTRPGDVVLLQFGHNDEKQEYARTYAAADGAYTGFLTAFVSDVRQRGAHPVLLTPVARRTFNAAGKIENSHAGYDDAVRALAAKLAVPLIDLTAMTTRMYETLGPEVSPSAFTNGGKDKTHHNVYGAYVIACFVARGLAATPALGIKPALDKPVCEPDRFGGPRDYGLVKSDWPILRAMPSVEPEQSASDKL